MTDNPKNIDSEEIKANIPIKLIRKVDLNKKTIVISYYQMDKNKKVQKQWTIKFKTKELA